MPQTAPMQGSGKDTAEMPAANPSRKELVYTRSGKLGLLRSETAHTVTIQLGPDKALTVPKDEIDCRFKLI